MYNTKYICLYNHVFQNLSEQDLSEQDLPEQSHQNALYKQDILEIFQVDEFDDELINDIMHKIYEKVKNNIELSKIMSLLAAKLLSIDKEIGFMLMFSFDYLYLSHSCISEYLEKGEITIEKLIQFMEKIEDTK
jgi:hypothetical protein